MKRSGAVVSVLMHHLAEHNSHELQQNPLTVVFLARQQMLVNGMAAHGLLELAQTTPERFFCLCREKVAAPVKETIFRRPTAYGGVVYYFRSASFWRILSNILHTKSSQ